MYRKYGQGKHLHWSRRYNRNYRDPEDFSYNNDKEFMKNDSNRKSFEKRGRGGGGTKVDNEFNPFSPAC